jgi:peptide/nickel transport system substrate-binding protein
MFVASGAAALGLLIAGAAGASTPNSAAPLARAASASSTLVIDTAFDLATADPGRMFEFTGQIVDRAIYSTLLTYSNDNLVVQPQLATGYGLSSGGDRYTFTLNPKAVFSDGTPVTCKETHRFSSMASRCQHKGRTRSSCRPKPRTQPSLRS